MPRRLRWLLGQPAFLWAVMGVVICTGLALRLWGIGLSLPYVDHPQESEVVDQAVRILKSGALDPRLLVRPSFYTYVCSLVFWTHVQIGNLFGPYSSLQNLPDSTSVFTLIPGFYLWGRVTSAVFGMGTVLLAYLSGRRHFDTGTGLVAAWLLAISPIVVERSHFISPDAPLSFFTMLSLYFALDSLRSERSLPIVWAALASAMAIGTGYAGAVAAVAPAIVWLLRAVPADRRLRDLIRRPRLFSIRRLGTPVIIAVPAALAAGMLMFTPFSPTDWAKLPSVLTSAPSGRIGGYLLDPALPAWLGHIVTVLLQRDWAVLVMGILGGLLVVWKRSRAAIVVLVLAVTYAVATDWSQTPFDGNYGAVMPAIALLGGWFTSMAIKGIMRLAPQAAVGVAFCCFIAVSAPTLAATASEDSYMSRQDTRTMAADWVRAEVDQGGRVAVELAPSQWAGVCRVLADGKPLDSRKLQWYKVQDYTHLVFVRPLGYDYGAFLSSLPSGVHERAAFRGAMQGAPGPDVYVFSTGSSADDMVVQEPVHATFGGRMELVGFDVGPIESFKSMINTLHSAPSPLEIRAGQIMGLNLYWQATKDINENWTVFAHLVDSDGKTVAQRDTFPQDVQCLRPTSLWKEGTLVYGPFSFPVPSSVPPGSYTLELGVYSAKTGARLTVTDQDGRVDNSLKLWQVVVH